MLKHLCLVFALFFALGCLVTAPSGTSAATYAGKTDRSVYPKPSLPRIGLASTSFVDPTFGSRILRVTDTLTRPGQSYTTPSAAHQTAWNTTGTSFYVRSVDGYFLRYTFDALNFTSAPAGVMSSQVEPQFSMVNATTLYGTRQDSTYDWPIVQRLDIASGAYTDILNLGSIAPIAHSTYAGGLSSSGDMPERLMVFFGGASQDAHYQVAVFSVTDPTALMLLDTSTSTLTINGVKSRTNQPLNFHLHHAWMDKGGRYVILETTSVDRGAPNYVQALYVWDTMTQAFNALPLSGGHYATGYGVMVNQDCCTATTWDAAQWQLRVLTTPTVTHDVISVLTPPETFLADHPSWNNAQPLSLVPFVTALYRYGANAAPWRAWDDEIVAIQTNGTPMNAEVWRIAHHRSTVLSFWDIPRVNVSQDGHYALFTSNWEQTLGAGREDVFVVELKLN